MMSICLFTVQSVSGTLDRPRVVAPSRLQDLRSCAILQASLALSPVSSSICCTHVRQGRPRWRFHSGLMTDGHCKRYRATGSHRAGFDVDVTPRTGGPVGRMLSIRWHCVTHSPQ